MELKARKTSKQTNIQTNKYRTLKMRCLKHPTKMEWRVEWSNIILQEQVSHIWCNHCRVCATVIIQQVSSVTLYVSTRVTSQNKTHYSRSNLLRSWPWLGKPHLESQESVRSGYKCQSYIAILDQSTRHSICARGLEAPLFLSTMFVCMYVGLFA